MPPLLIALQAGLAFACTPVAVWDGDGPIWCAEGPRVRLQGIAAREIVRQPDGALADGGCKPSHPCPARSGVEARRELVRLLGGQRGVRREGHAIVRAPTMRCLSHGSAGGKRTAATCDLPGVGDLSCAMLRTRAAVRWARYRLACGGE